MAKLAYFIDGMNEKGLAVELLSFKMAKYPSSKDYPGYKDIPVIYACEWLLGNCSTVEEVKLALAKTVITEFPADGLNLAVHIVVNDKSGKSIVIEPVDGQNASLRKLPENSYTWRKTEKYEKVLRLPGTSLPADRLIKGYFLNKPQNQSAVLELAAILDKFKIVECELVAPNNTLG